MNHPKSEDWALYVSKEMAPERSRELINHLRECPACAADLAALERSARRLAAWEFPEERESVHYWAAPLIKWGIAAALVLGVGFALGKVSPPPARDVTRVRAEIEASTRALLAADLRRALDEAQAHTNEALATMETRLGQTSEEQMNRALRNVVAAVTTAREEDRRATRALLEQVRQQHETEIRRVRADLETVAAHADDELRFAHFQLNQLTAQTEKQ